MRLQIRSRDVKLSKALRSRVERRLALALGRFGACIGPVTVRISDGGVDPRSSTTRCHIDVAFRPRHVDAEDVDRDVLTAVNHAAHRVARSIERLLDLEGKP